MIGMVGAHRPKPPTNKKKTSPTKCTRHAGACICLIHTSIMCRAYDCLVAGMYFLAFAQRVPSTQKKQSLAYAFMLTRTLNQEPVVLCVLVRWGCICIRVGTVCGNGRERGPGALGHEPRRIEAQRPRPPGAQSPPSSPSSPPPPPPPPSPPPPPTSRAPRRGCAARQRREGAGIAGRAGGWCVRRGGS
eukprot:280398-Rhodomonas_salina.1